MVANLSELSNQQLCQVYNALTGQTVKRFTSIAEGVQRIAKVLNATSTNLRDALELAGLEEADAPQEDADTPMDVELPPAEVDEPKPYKDRHGFVHRKREPKKERKPRGGGRLETVLGLLRRPGGATVPEIMEATGWLPHTTRAYLSKGGAAGKAATITSERVERDGKKASVYSASPGRFAVR